MYTGIAANVERKFAEHQANKGAKYLCGRGPLKLVFKKQMEDRWKYIGSRRLPQIGIMWYFWA
jgi:predicted GIY-YIG superfamily endonuclease